MNVYDFQEQLAFSIEGRVENDGALIRQIISGCVSVVKSDQKDDRSGIDYWATLRRGSQIGIDLKLRSKGCSRWWCEGPELALETWSVLPDEQHKGKVGWTLDESKRTDYTLHRFDPTDTTMVYLLPFQLLRMTFRDHIKQWTNRYRVEQQNSGTWRSQVVFVPATVVLAGISAKMLHKTNLEPSERGEHHDDERDC